MRVYTTNKYIILTGFLVLVFLVAFFIIDINLSEYNIIMFDTMLFYPPFIFYDNEVLLNLYTPSSYIVYRLLDTVFPFVYGLLLYGLLARYKVSKLNYLPGVVVVLDIIENTVIIMVQFVISTSSDLVIYLLNTATILKFSLLLVIVVIIVLRLTGLNKTL